MADAGADLSGNRVGSFAGDFVNPELGNLHLRRDNELKPDADCSVEFDFDRKKRARMCFVGADEIVRGISE